MNAQEQEHIQQLADRITVIEKKVDRLLMLFERTTGAWMLLKWGGSAIIGITSIWAILFDHIRIK